MIDDTRIEIRDAVKLGATLDHRYIDGYQGAAVGKTIRECFENPELLDDPAYLLQPPVFVNPEDKRSSAVESKKEK